MSFRSILVVKPSSMGDVIHTLPAVALLKRAWPQAALRWLVNPEWAPLLEGNPDVDEIIPFPRRELSGIGKLSAQIAWLRQMRSRYRSELVLDFQGLLRSAIVGRVCRRADGGTFLGLSDSREGARFFYDRTVPVQREHAVTRYLTLVASLGVDPSGSPVWRLPLGNRPAGFDLEEPFCLLHPFARGAGKSLSSADVEAFCKALPFPVVLAGRTDEKIAPAEKTLNLLNRTSIPELLWLIRRARYVVSVDSGPMHIAAALTPRLVGIHTWSDPALVGPFQPEAWIWQDRVVSQVKALRQPASKPMTVVNVIALAAFVGRQMEAEDILRTGA